MKTKCNPERLCRSEWVKLRDHKMEDRRSRKCFDACSDSNPRTLAAVLTKLTYQHFFQILISHLLGESSILHAVQIENNNGINWNYFVFLPEFMPLPIVRKLLGKVLEKKNEQLVRGALVRSGWSRIAARLSVGLQWTPLFMARRALASSL